MEGLKELVRRAVHLMPRSRSVFAVCQLYCQRFEESGYENNSDIHTNGELRLLQEVAADIDVAFDVGANAGEWTALLLSLAPQVSHVYAFEPCSSAYANLIDHSFPPSVSLHRMGLSSRSGKAPLYIFAEAGVLNALCNRQGLENGWGIHPTDTTEEVILDTIDSFCEKQHIQGVDFVKIDTEGHEVDVLEGARGSLTQGIIKIVQFEYGGGYIDSRRFLKDIFQLIAPLDYTVFLLAPGMIRE